MGVWSSSVGISELEHHLKSLQKLSTFLRETELGTDLARVILDARSQSMTSVVRQWSHDSTSERADISDVSQHTHDHHDFHHSCLGPMMKQINIKMAITNMLHLFTKTSTSAAQC